MITIKNLDYYYNIKKKDNSKKIFKWKKEKILAINDINLNIEDGSRNAIIGFNGAGKSTLIKLIIGILKPAKGYIDANGINPWRDRIKHVKNIGVVWGQRSTLWWELPIVESFKAIKKMYHISDAEYERNIENLDNKLNFKSYWNKPIRKLSLGQRAKVEIVAALVHNPKILILDEPFLGLDFISRKYILTALDELISEKKITLILTSHNINDINDLCENIIVMKNGKVILNDNIESFKNVDSYVVELIIEKNDYLELKVPENQNIEVNKEAKENIYSVKFNEDILKTETLIGEIIRANTGIVGIKIKEKSLENVLEKLLISKEERKKC